jgi:hypothetical protein
MTRARCDTKEREAEHRAGGKMTTIEHGPETACYSNEGTGRPTCFLICVCGKFFRARSWEEVGADFDEHLEETEEVVSP